MPYTAQLHFKAQFESLPKAIEAVGALAYPGLKLDSVTFYETPEFEKPDFKTDSPPDTTHSNGDQAPKANGSNGHSIVTTLPVKTRTKKASAAPAEAAPAADTPPAGTVAATDDAAPATEPAEPAEPTTQAAAAAPAPAADPAETPPDASTSPVVTSSADPSEPPAAAPEAAPQLPAAAGDEKQDDLIRDLMQQVFQSGASGRTAVKTAMDQHGGGAPNVSSMKPECKTAYIAALQELVHG